MTKKFFVTTPIYYVNDVPHIGHACTTIAADILARSHRQRGEEVFFLTGTDEHGAKIAQAAEKEGLSPLEFCDKIAPQFEENWKKLDISYDYFIRTTNPEHEKVVQALILKIKENGYIYDATYKGWYCVGCEAFKTPDELVDGKCVEHPNKDLEWYEEKNWFLNLRKVIADNPTVFEKLAYSFPENKRNEMLGKIKIMENDVSISRANVKWGIPIPWDTEQTVYVWFDALINYYSATRFVDGKAEFWPADVHLVGKGINWFHSVIWQGMLLAAGIDIPKKVFAHSHYNTAGQKMSKSLGNVIAPFELVNKFGVDATRYMIAKSFPENDDSDITWEKLTETYNADLANNLGNLVSRLAALAEGLEIDKKEIKISIEYLEKIDNFALPSACEWVFKNYIDPINQKLNEVKPWKLEANDPVRITFLKESIGNLLIATHHLKPIMPNAAKDIIEHFERKIEKKQTPVFARI